MQIRTLDEMDIKELENEIKSLEKESYNTEWQNEFVRQEIIEIRSLIEKKKFEH